MKTILWVSLLGTCAGASGCADGNACDPDMERDRNYCLKVSPDEAAGGMGGEPTVPGEPPAPVEPSEVFGAVCTLDNEADVCGGDAPDCGLQPGADQGICTVFGCQTEPSTVVCPIGWSCFGLGDACLED